MARVSIEDCKKNMANRFALVVVAANRARQLMGNSTPLVNSKNKEVVVALREIAEGKVSLKTIEDSAINKLRKVKSESKEFLSKFKSDFANKFRDNT